MRHKTDMVAALQRRQPPCAVPLWELEFQLWDAFSGDHLMLGQEFSSLSGAAQQRALRRNAEIILTVCRDLGFAGVSAPTPPWEQSPGVLAYYILPEAARFEQVAALRAATADDVMIVGHATGVLAATYSADFCAALVESPEEIDMLARQWLQRGLEAARRLRDAGAEAAFTASDLADNSGPFFKMDQMDRFVIPYLDRWARQCKAMGLYTILHTDGRLPPPWLNAIADTAVDALQAIDPTAGMDMAATKALVGNRLCLCGNVDCGLLCSGTPDQVEQSAARLLNACKAGGGFVLGASNAVQREVPADNYRAMLTAWKRHGDYSPP
jgi:uroporphyrinogen decarboxylase